MTEKIILGMWKNAPFQGAINSSVDRLNSFLVEHKLDMEYDIMRLTPEELSDNMVLPNVFILDGGEDVDPSRYGERNRYSHFSKARDKIEFAFAEFMSNCGVRLAGVCRGHQLLNVFLGGTLYQDIKLDGCIYEGMKHFSGHKVRAGGGKRYPMSNNIPIVDFVGVHSFSVSSLHHQAVNMFGKNVYPTLAWEQYSEKNSRGVSHIIEGIETKNSMVRGVQSHPEFKGFPKDGLLFAYLMYVDYFSTPIFKVSDREIEEKFEKLISRKQRDKHSKKYANLNLGRRGGATATMNNVEDMEETLREERQRERDSYR